MLHPPSPSERSVCFDDDVMLVAEGSDLGPGVERVNFDLVDGWMQSRFRCEKLLQLRTGA